MKEDDRLTKGLTLFVQLVIGGIIGIVGFRWLRGATIDMDTMPIRVVAVVIVSAVIATIAALRTN
jgi:hypothetical protein